MQNSQLAHMEDQAPITSFGRYLRKIRITRKVTLRELANRAQPSPSYISSIESGSATPPPRETTERILDALDPEDAEREALFILGMTARGSTEFDERLPEEVRFLICELRGDGHKLPDRFVRALRVYVKEAVS